MNRVEMEKLMLEAATIEQMTTHEGWQILKRYCENTMRLSHETWLYVDEDNSTAKELKKTARTAHAMLNLVENFKEEGKRLWALWTRAQGLAPGVAMDMDNLSPNVEEEA